MVLAAGWGLQFPCTWPPILQQTDFLTQWPQGRGLRGWKQKLQGHLRLSLQNSYNVAPTTFYESKQITGQPRFKRWGNRLHHLTEGATQKTIFNVPQKVTAHVNGNYKGALSIAASKCSQWIIRNLSRMSSFSLFCSMLALFSGKLFIHSNHQPL